MPGFTKKHDNHSEIHRLPFRAQQYIPIFILVNKLTPVRTRRSVNLIGPFNLIVPIRTSEIRTESSTLQTLGVERKVSFS